MPTPVICYQRSIYELKSKRQLKSSQGEQNAETHSNDAIYV